MRKSLRLILFAVLVVSLQSLPVLAQGTNCSNSSFGNGFTCVQQASNFNGGSVATSVSAPLPNKVAAGDTLLVASEAAYPSLGEVVHSVTDSLGNTYTPIASSVNTHCAHYMEWFYASNVVGGSDTVTANFSGYANGGGGTVVPMEWSGVGGFDVAGLDGNSSCPWSSDVTTGFISTGNSVDLLLAFFVDTSGAESIAAGSGYTLVNSFLGAADHAVEAQSVSSIGGFDASFTLGGSVNWEADIVAFKSSASGGQGTSCSNTSFGNGFTCIQKASSFNGGTANSSVSAPLPSNVTAGDTILVATESAFPAGGEIVSSVTDSLGNTYTPITSSVNTDCAHYIEWFYASDVAGGSDTVTANFSGYSNGGGGTVAPMEWSGVGGFDVAGLDVNSSCPFSSTVETASITTGNAVDLLLAFFVDTSGAQSISAGTGYTLIDSVFAAADHGIEAESVSSTGSYDATFTLGGSVNWEADIVAFTSASSGPPPTLVSIAVTPANPSIISGTTQQFTATGTYSDGSRRNLTSTVTWSSSSTSVATINSSGLADGVGSGQTTIQASLDGIPGSTSLTVTPATSGCANTGVGNGFSCVQAASNFNGGSVATSVSATLASSVTTGNSILVATEAAYPGSGEIVNSVTDSLGNTYTAIASSVNTHCAHYTEWFYASNVVGGSDTVTANFAGDPNGGGGTVAAMEWSGVGGFDVAGLDGNSSCPWSSEVTTAFISTGNSVDLLLAFFVDTSGAESIAAGSGYTLINSFLGAADHGIEAESVSSTGSYDATFSLGGSVNWEADIVAFKSSTAP